MKEPKLNEVFEHEGVKLRCEKSPHTICDGCYGYSNDNFDKCDDEWACCESERNDNTRVIFVEVNT